MAFDYAAKIQALLANANDERLPDEARASYRTKAEQLMRDYRIAEEDAIAREIVGHEPIRSDVRVTSNHTRLAAWYQDAFSAIARHTGIRVAYRWDGGWVAQVVGYEGDVRYAEFLWTAALLMFATRIDPRWDDTLSMDENVYRLRASGMKRKDVAYAAGLDGANPAHRSRVQNIYLRECAARGENPAAAGLGHNADAFRQAYADSFCSTLRYRLREARDAADAVGGGLVLHGRSDRVDEAFYAAFPHLRPKPRVDVDDTPAEPCKRCAKNPSKSCREHPAYTVDKSTLRRWEAVSRSPGNAAGRRAAEGVVIERGTTRANRLDASGRAIEG